LLSARWKGENRMAAPAAEAPALAQSVLLNPVVKNLAALAVRAWEKCWIVTFTAPTGVGKTTAVDYADRTLPFEHRTIRCKQITTRYTLLQPLALAPGEKWNTHGRNWMRASDLYYRAVERMRQRPYLLIVDEADRLRMDCFEILRDFWDDARLPMLLVGNEVLTQKINHQHERLFRRIRVRYTQPPLRDADLRKTVEFMGYTVDDDEFALLWKSVGGSPGFAEALLENANAIAESHGRKRDLDALEGALRYFPPLKAGV
jgi:DNA transposition AAA+ family ATPase